MKEYTYHDVNLRGTITRVNYTTTNSDGVERDKYANIYLPYGYDQQNKAKKYNILYVMHGGGGNADAWLDCCKIKNMLDYSFSAGEAEPFIVVFPSFYKELISRVGPPNGDVERAHVLFFQKELVEDLLPAVESIVNGYAEDTTVEGLKAARTHRGFGGFSMGSCTTWFAFMQHLDYFSIFVPLSGDCWIVEPRGGASAPAETAKLLHDEASASGYTASDYRIFAATGEKDPAVDALSPQIAEMKKFTDTFVYSEDASKGNLHYFVQPDYVHSYECVYQYLYNYLPYLFH